MSSRLLKSLIRSNQGILEQKLSLLDVLQAKHGLVETCELFTRVCPIAGASIGAHYRHSMDHVELSVLVASNQVLHLGTRLDSSETGGAAITLNYDLRVRGGTLEKDVNEARKRIQNTHNVLEEMIKNVDEEGVGRSLCDEVINASFMLSSDGNEEFKLQSSIGRELGFVAHHAIHHLAMVRIIATHTLGLGETELPPNFGKAPSTVRFENER